MKILYQKTERQINYLRRRPYLKRVTDTLVRRVSGGANNALNLSDISIISSNCFAGRIMQDAKMEYNSPTLGLYFMYPDFIEFLRNIKYYLTEAKIEFVEKSKYPLGNERRENRKVWYPIGLLGGKVEIHFLHYHTEKDAAEKWYRRASRVNFDYLFVIAMDQNLCTEQDVLDFDKLPYQNKIIFSKHKIDLESNEYMPEFAGCREVGDAYGKGHLYYKHFIDHFSKE